MDTYSRIQELADNLEIENSRNKSLAKISEFTVSHPLHSNETADQGSPVRSKSKCSSRNHRYDPKFDCSSRNPLFDTKPGCRLNADQEIPSLIPNMAADQGIPN